MTTTTQRTQRSPKISLFHVKGARSERVVWTATELQIAYDVVSPAAPARRGEFQAAHPLTKVPAITAPQGSLFESLAICNWLADNHPDRNLGWPVGTWERALHDQWASFTLAELEANLWHTARNKFVYPEHRKVPQVYEQNADEARRALAAFDGHLEGRDWLVGKRFSLTDIFCGFAISWAAMDGLTGDFASIENYLTRLLALPNCPYTRSR